MGTLVGALNGSKNAYVSRHFAMAQKCTLEQATSHTIEWKRSFGGFFSAQEFLHKSSSLRLLVPLSSSV